MSVNINEGNRRTLTVFDIFHYAVTKPGFLVSVIEDTITDLWKHSIAPSITPSQREIKLWMAIDSNGLILI